MFDEIPISPIKLAEGRFQTFHDISLSEELRWKSHRPYNKKKIIRGASPGTPLELWDKNTIGWRRWNVATQERKVFDMEVEIVTFFVKWGAQLTVTLDRQEKIQGGSRDVALRRVFDLKLSGIHLTEIILKSGLLIDNASSMYLYVKLNWDANFFFPVQSKYCMNSASYGYRNMSARRGAQFVPIKMPTICCKTFPLKTTWKISSTRFGWLVVLRIYVGF